ncbi:MAG TPA: hypothetical protein VK817_26760 [Trebonia sp.]|jgi:predicted HD phosphohydrolase|nr:hypothetical protein [Trebonia sp.]
MSPVDEIAALFKSEGARDYLGEPVTVAAQPVRLHVAAKRYLCAAEPGYFALLSEASVYTLSVQGGPMTGEQAREFAACPYAADAIRVRRWDEQVKDPGADTPEFSAFRPVLDRLLR